MEGFKYERNDRKSRASRLPCGDHADPHRGQVEGADPLRSAPWNKTLWGVKKIHRQCVPKGLDRPTPGNGGKQACSP